MQPDAHGDNIGNILAKTRATTFRTLGILQIHFEHTLAVSGFVLLAVTLLLAINPLNLDKMPSIPHFSEPKSVVYYIFWNQ